MLSHKRHRIIIMGLLGPGLGNNSRGKNSLGNNGLDITTVAEETVVVKDGRGKNGLVKTVIRILR